MIRTPLTSVVQWRAPISSSKCRYPTLRASWFPGMVKTGASIRER
jgi:hypothetical protein